MHLCFFSALLICSFTAFTQSSNSGKTPADSPQSVKLLQHNTIEFRITDSIKLSEELLQKIDFGKYADLRTDSEDVIITDDVTGLTFILYSREKAMFNRIASKYSVPELFDN